MNFYINLKEFKNQLFKKDNIFFSILVIIIFFLDRFTKFQIINNVTEAPYYVNEYVNFDLIWNIGIGFGFLSSTSSIIYNLITTLIAMVILIIFFVFLNSKNLDKFVYSFIIGGALGNFYDRITYKAVPDFIDLHYNNFHWFTFNVADIFISIGILFFIVNGFFVKN
jgi:signal peptidase II|tara:strand:+ start:1487 stop:1987 length:501 start_codon:yes stop_codon:yes gene_type:complete